MKIKRVLAKDMRQGIRRVREELGEDAVILSNRKVDDGVEIVVGIDYDESALNNPSASYLTNSKAKQPDSQLDIFSEEAQASARASFQEVINNASQGLDSLLDDEISTDVTYSKPTKPKPVIESEPPKAKPLASKPINAKDDDILFDDMRTELKSLRGILENQLSGLAWGEMSRSHPNQAILLKRYIEMGLENSLSHELVDEVSNEEDIESAWRMSLDLLANQIVTTGEDFIAEGGVVAFVGPTGVGKTTTVAKLAARYALQHGYQQVALVTTDSYRIGAHEQLKTYGRILGVPVRVANDAEELKTVLHSLSDKRLVLIDTAGMSQRDLRLTEQFHSVLSGAPKLKTCVVLSANTQAAGLTDVMRSFSRVKIDACVLTKIDEAVSLGGALSLLVENRLPLAYISDGQQVPEDIHKAHPHNLINRAQQLLMETEQSIDEQTAAMAMGGVLSNAK
ncbi:MAG: flagellar biosynthesis protein FlhF [Gammaproteobacteria bacterium]|nr:flagellar biosynthesis protein FlhF [Gammaproteobacteria bacterium]